MARHWFRLRQRDAQRARVRQGRMPSPPGGRWSLAVLLLVCASASWAANCNVSAQGVSFGNYDPFSTTALDSTGTITVICDASTMYTISLSTGSGSYATRTMRKGAHTLNYNLYTNASRSIIWGDGTGNTALVNDTGLGGNYTIYGRAPARQNPYVGTYFDTIVVTLNLQ
jgi:spore coat protein U-like protein